MQAMLTTASNDLPFPSTFNPPPNWWAVLLLFIGIAAAIAILFLLDKTEPGSSDQDQGGRHAAPEPSHPSPGGIPLWYRGLDLNSLPSEPTPPRRRALVGAGAPTVR
jgi:hypothetical protein